MIQNGMSFGMEGPIIKGNWYNPETGDSFTVRDSFFQDNQLIVTTMDGRTIDYNKFQNYIQSDKPMDKEMLKANSKQKQPEELPQEVLSILEDDNAIISNPYSSPIPKPIPSNNIVDVNPDNIILNKVLSKSPIPKVNINLDVKKLPLDKIKTIQEMMDVDIESILDWYSAKINYQELIDSIKKQVRTQIKQFIEGENVIKTSKKVKTSISK